MYKASCAHVCSTWKENIQANFMWNFHGKFISHEVHACALYSCKCKYISPCLITGCPLWWYRHWSRSYWRSRWGVTLTRWRTACQGTQSRRRHCSPSISTIDGTRCPHFPIWHPSEMQLLSLTHLYTAV